MKGVFGIKLSNSYSHLKQIPIELHSIWDVISLLYLHSKKIILISGLSEFKTFLASLPLEDASVLILHQETNVPQLLGSIILGNSQISKYFYPEQFCKISQQNTQFQLLKEKMEKYFNNIDEIRLETENSRVLTDNSSESFDGEVNFIFPSDNSLIWNEKDGFSSPDESSPLSKLNLDEQIENKHQPPQMHQFETLPKKIIIESKQNGTISESFIPIIENLF
jgi:hypothetical protein